MSQDKISQYHFTIDPHVFILNNASKMLCYPTMSTTSRRNRKQFSKAATALRVRRTELGLNQEDVVERSGDLLTQSNISDLENDRTSIGRIGTRKAFALATALEWSILELQEKTGEDLGAREEKVGGVEPVRIPAFDVGSLAAGLRGYEQQETPDRYMAFHPAEVPRGVPAEKLFMIRVGGDSMYEENMTRPIPEGAWIMVERTNVAVDGQIVVAYIPDMDVAVVKQITRDEKSRNYLLRSYKIGGPTFWAQEHPDIRIQGVVRRLVYEF